MADLKITDLGAALSVGDSNVTVLDDGTSTMKVTMNQLKEFIIGTTDISGIGNGTATGAISSVNTSKNNVRDSIAPTETSTASRAYEVDEKMYISDVLYKATRAIALGDSLVSGTNITPANDVSTEILELKSDASEAIDSVKNIIAPVEDGGTAVLSYSAGDQFIHLGALCKAKTTINAGDTLIINTNYEDVGQVVDQLDSVKQALSNEVSTRATLGAHNLFVGDWGVTRTDKGITWTINADGTIDVSGAINTSDTSAYIQATYTLPAGSYKFTGAASGGGNNKWMIMVMTVSSELGRDYGDGIEFTLNEDTLIYVRLYVYKSYGTYSGLKFSPMARLASDTDTSYQPPAMTNKQITPLVTLSPVAKSYTPTITGTNTGFTAIWPDFVYTKLGKLLFVSGRFTITNAGTGDGNIKISLPDGISSYFSGYGGCGSTSAPGYFPYVNNNGTEIEIHSKGNGASIPSIGADNINVFAVILCK